MGDRPEGGGRGVIRHVRTLCESVNTKALTKAGMHSFMEQACVDDAVQNPEDAIVQETNVRIRSLRVESSRLASAMASRCVSPSFSANTVA